MLLIIPKPRCYCWESVRNATLQ